MDLSNSRKSALYFILLKPKALKRNRVENETAPAETKEHQNTKAASPKVPATVQITTSPHLTPPPSLFSSLQSTYSSTRLPLSPPSRWSYPSSSSKTGSTSIHSIVSPAPHPAVAPLFYPRQWRKQKADYSRTEAKPAWQNGTHPTMTKRK